MAALTEVGIAVVKNPAEIGTTAKKILEERGLLKQTRATTYSVEKTGDIRNIPARTTVNVGEFIR